MGLDVSLNSCIFEHYCRMEFGHEDHSLDEDLQCISMETDGTFSATKLETLRQVSGKME